jgi:uncharacterized membrane protein YeaQ/YmgE (transglycosylase-associated protein family)
MRFVILAVIGAAAGFVATRIMRVELGLFETIAVGILGAIVGGLILEFVAAAFGFLGGFAGAVLGALLLIWAYKAFVGGRR